MTFKHLHIKSIEDICDSVSDAFSNQNYIRRLNTTTDKWLDVDYETVFNTILYYIYSI